MGLLDPTADRETSRVAGLAEDRLGALVLGARRAEVGRDAREVAVVADPLDQVGV